MAFVFAFAFRAFVVEAFVIPTGSMAPTLLGNHVEVVCEQCGYRFRFSPENNGRRRSPNYAYRIEVQCPQCGNLIRRERARINTGDRILVLKYLYAFKEPSRWDVVVFKNPKKPDVNYIKRLVGLPNERIWVARGNVFFKKRGKADWQAARKPPDVQRAVWQPVYHSKYFPLDSGDRRRRDWRCPWDPVRGSWSPVRKGRMGSASPAEAHTYHYRPAAEERGGGTPGVLAFRFNGPEQSPYARNYYAYNALTRSGARGRNCFEDVRVAATVIPEERGLGLWMKTTGRKRAFRATIDAEGVARFRSRPQRASGEWRRVAKKRVGTLSPGRATRVELWHVDQALSLWVDGERVLHWTYEADPHALDEAGAPEKPPAIRIGVEGAAAKLRRVNLDRDMYYTQPTATALGTTEGGARIGPDEFYVLGDNSPESEDSRRWDRVNEVVRAQTGVKEGRVPRKLMLGRAFFVYFPPPHRWRPDGMALVPNFGRMRFID